MPVTLELVSLTLELVMPVTLELELVPVTLELVSVTQAALMQKPRSAQIRRNLMMWGDVGAKCRCTSTRARNTTHTAWAIDLDVGGRCAVKGRVAALDLGV